MREGLAAHLAGVTIDFQTPGITIPQGESDACGLGRRRPGSRIG
jgi:hypothetical protein